MGPSGKPSGKPSGRRREGPGSELRGKVGGWAVGVAALALGAPLVPPADAAGLALMMYGPRAGLSISPDQVTIGMFTDWGEIANDLRVRVDGDLGFLDDLFTLNLNGQVQYHFTKENEPLEPYAGGGVGFLYGNTEVDSGSHVGLNLFAGIQQDLGGFKTGILELRIGVDRLPDVKITAAVGFQ